VKFWQARTLLQLPSQCFFYGQLTGAFEVYGARFPRVATFLATAVAIRGVPYFPSTLTGADRVMLVKTLFYFFGALECIAAAWLLSHWVYGVGLLRSLSKYRVRLTGRNHV
jgi:hypothetical protein